MNTFRGTHHSESHSCWQRLDAFKFAYGAVCSFQISVADAGSKRHLIGAGIDRQQRPTHANFTVELSITRTTEPSHKKVERHRGSIVRTLFLLAIAPVIDSAFLAPPSTDSALMDFATP